MVSKVVQKHNVRISFIHKAACISVHETYLSTKIELINQYTGIAQTDKFNYTVSL